MINGLWVNVSWFHPPSQVRRTSRTRVWNETHTCLRKIHTLPGFFFGGVLHTLKTRKVGASRVMRPPIGVNTMCKHIAVSRLLWSPTNPAKTIYASKYLTHRTRWLGFGIHHTDQRGTQVRREITRGWGGKDTDQRVLSFGTKSPWEGHEEQTIQAEPSPVGEEYK